MEVQLHEQASQHFKEAVSLLAKAYAAEDRCLAARSAATLAEAESAAQHASAATLKATAAQAELQVRRSGRGPLSINMGNQTSWARESKHTMIFVRLAEY